MKAENDTYKQISSEIQMESITTTIGDLVCAIRDAAEEARVDSSSMDELTHLILMDLLRRSK